MKETARIAFPEKSGFLQIYSVFNNLQPGRNTGGHCQGFGTNIQIGGGSWISVVLKEKKKYGNIF